MRPNEAAGKSILLRSNLTVHNTLKCHLYVLLETFHNADDLVTPTLTLTLALTLTLTLTLTLASSNPSPSPSPNSDP